MEHFLFKCRSADSLRHPPALFLSFRPQYQWLQRTLRATRGSATTCTRCSASGHSLSLAASARLPTPAAAPQRAALRSSRRSRASSRRVLSKWCAVCFEQWCASSAPLAKSNALNKARSRPTRCTLNIGKYKCIVFLRRWMHTIRLSIVLYL